MAAPSDSTGSNRLTWSTVAPAPAVIALVLTWGRTLSPVVVIVVAVLLGACVLAAVHHAEVVALRVGEPFGSLTLAVAVTTIEVALIVTLMASGGSDASTLARDTVFAAVMISCNGILGLSIILGTGRSGLSNFNAEGTGGALATVATLTTTCLVLPTFTLGAPGPQFTGAQLTFAAIASVAIYAMFVATQTGRHRDFFLPVTSKGTILDEDSHAAPPSTRAALVSLGLLLVSLVAVVGLAKVEAPAIESAVVSAGFPKAVVGVVIALLVLLPETLAAVRAARRRRVQTSINLAYGSAIASVGLTIPSLAVATIWLDGPLVLGLGSLEMVLLVATVAVGMLTVVPGRATRLQGGLHLVLVTAYVFLAFNP
jgi:Ca2+:H+ antiporter